MKNFKKIVLGIVTVLTVMVLVACQSEKSEENEGDKKRVRFN